MLKEFFDSQDVINYKFILENHKVNKTMQRPTDIFLAICEKPLAVNTFIFGNLTAPPQKCTSSHAPYSPDLACAKHYLFPRMKAILKGCCFRSEEEVNRGQKHLRRPQEKVCRNDCSSGMAAGRDVQCSAVHGSMMTSKLTQTKIHELLGTTMYALYKIKEGRKKSG